MRGRFLRKAAKGMANAQLLSPMMTALMIFLGLSASMSLFIIGSVVLGARRNAYATNAMAEALGSPSYSGASTPSFVPSFSH